MATKKKAVKKATVAKPKTPPITERKYTIIDPEENAYDAPKPGCSWDEVVAWLKDIYKDDGDGEDANSFLSSFLDDNRLIIVYALPNGVVRELPHCAWDAQSTEITITPSENGCHPDDLD